MERVSLCPACTACPEVVMEGDTIRIGEDANVVVLKKAEWNVLVDAIKSGRLDRCDRRGGVGSSPDASLLTAFKAAHPPERVRPASARKKKLPLVTTSSPGFTPSSTSS